MLTFFPTPLEGEWWYSVLCRYHVRSGNQHAQTTVKELFQGSPKARMGAFFPNCTVHQVLSQLPAGWDCKEIIVRHTLFPYFMRMHILEDKERTLAQLCKGESPNWTHIWKTAKKSVLRYCPICVKKDIETYGEPYWHTVHQLPLVTMCCEHHCRLLPIFQQNQSLHEHFYPLSEQPLSEEILPAGFSWEEPLSRILAEHQTKPYQICPTPTHNNLTQTLINLGYGLNRTKSIRVDVSRLYQDMRQFYGTDLMETVFGDEISAFMISRVAKWGLSSPERYALLQGFTGVPFDVLFSPEPIPDELFQKLKALSETGVTYGKKALAEKLGVKPVQLGYLAKKYQIEPFWDGTMQAVGEKTSKFVMYCTPEEWEKIHKAAEKMGFRYDSHFIGFCIQKVMDEMED